METRIFDCVNNDDLDQLKLLTDHPAFFQIEDASGHTVLQTAIIMNNIAVFDFILSLDGCPINARNSKGTTALEVALSPYSRAYEHFAYSLLKKNVIIDRNCDTTTLLREAIYKNYLKVAKLLIERGADLNCQIASGDTPLHMIRRIRDNRNEWLAMMLYFGADPSIPNNQDCRVIDFAFLNGIFSESMQEHLVLYFFDDYCTGYKIPIDNLFGLLQSDYSFVPQVLKHITSVNLDEHRPYKYLETFFTKLFIIKPKYLQLLLEKFNYVMQSIIDPSLEYDFTECPNSKEMFIENFDLLLQSQFSSDVIQIFNKARMSELFTKFARSKTPPSELIGSVMILLSYGANFYDSDLEYIYLIFGDCEFFRILLHMDIINRDSDGYYIPVCEDSSTLTIRRVPYGIMPGLLYKIHTNIETFLSDTHCTENVLKELLNYFACPKLKSLCYSLPSTYEDIHAKVKDLPSVPLLVELARNEVRKFLVRKYRIKNSMQFYTLIKHLPISKVHQKIITLETKLY